MRCGADHHTINFATGKSTRLHHMAFELRDWAHVQVACDHLGRMNVPIIWGPGRHGISHNIFVYHRDPDDQMIEFYIRDGPDAGRGARLFRSASLAQGPSATAQGLGPPIGGADLGPPQGPDHARQRNIE